MLLYSGGHLSSAELSPAECAAYHELYWLWKLEAMAVSEAG